MTTTPDAVIVLGFAKDRALARQWIDRAPVNTRIWFKAPKRTLPQNDKLHALLTDIARQQTWHGLKLTVEDWKDLFAAALKRELRTVPNLEGDGMVILGDRTSTMSVEEASNLIELILMKGAEWGVTWSEPKAPAPSQLETANG